MVVHSESPCSEVLTNKQACLLHIKFYWLIRLLKTQGDWSEFALLQHIERKSSLHDQNIVPWHFEPHFRQSWIWALYFEPPLIHTHPWWTPTYPHTPMVTEPLSCWVSSLLTSNKTDYLMRILLQIQRLNGNQCRCWSYGFLRGNLILI